MPLREGCRKQQPDVHLLLTGTLARGGAGYSPFFIPGKNELISP